MRKRLVFTCQMVFLLMSVFTIFEPLWAQQPSYEAGNIIINIKGENNSLLNGYLLIKLPPPIVFPRNLQDEFYPYFSDSSPVNISSSGTNYSGYVLKCYYVSNGRIHFNVSDIKDLTSVYMNATDIWLRADTLLPNETRFLFFYPTAPGTDVAGPINDSEIVNKIAATNGGTVTWWTLHYRSSDDKPLIQNVALVGKDDWTETEPFSCSGSNCYFPNHTAKQNYVLEPPYDAASNLTDHIYNGDKEPVVLVHGINGQAGEWKDNVKRLRGNEHTVNTWTFNYRGTHDIANSAYLMKLAIDEIKSIYPANRKVNIVTHSYGGVIARKYCIETSNSAQNKIHKVIMTGPPHHGSYASQRTYQMDAAVLDQRLWLFQSQWTLDPLAPIYRELTPGSDSLMAMADKEFPLGIEAVVIAGTKTYFWAGIAHDEAPDHDDGVVSISSASLLPVGVPLLFAYVDHTDMTANDKVAETVSALIGNHLPSPGPSEFVRYMIDEAYPRTNLPSYQSEYPQPSIIDHQELDRAGLIVDCHQAAYDIDAVEMRSHAEELKTYQLEKQPFPFEKVFIYRDTSIGLGGHGIAYKLANPLWEEVELVFYYQGIEKGRKNVVIYPCSTNIVSMASYFDVTSPTTGSSYTIGQTIPIRWSSKGDTGSYVRIEISRDGGSSGSNWSPIAESTSNNGAYDWIATSPVSSGCLIRIVSTSYTSVNGLSTAFSITAYTPSAAIPTYAWHTFYGSSNFDNGKKIAIDGNGNTYIIGICDTSWGSPLHPHSGGNDIFVMKLDSSGAYQWHTFYGSSSRDEGYGIAVDNSGNVYVTGLSTATWGSPLHPYSGGSLDTFIMKLDSSGAYQWHTFYGPSSDYEGYNIAVDNSGNVYVTGSSPVTWGSPLHPYGAGNNLFVMKLDSSGAYQWHTFYGSISTCFGYGIAVDNSGNVYVTGLATLTWGSPLHPYSGNNNIFVMKLDSSGAYQWHTFYGSSGPALGFGIAVDNSGNVYVTGVSTATWGSPLHPYGGGSLDTFIMKLDSSGAYQWHTFYGSSSNDYGYGIAVDNSGNVYVTGTSLASWGSPLHPYNGWDIFVMKLDSSGAYQWHTFYGSSSLDYGYGIAVDNSGNVYVTGTGPVTWGSPLHPDSGGGDIFILKLSQMTKGDFNKDGKTDILMQNVNSGHLAVWFMDRTTFLSDTVLSQITNYAGGWRVVGTGDFDSDGNTDILMQNINSGHLAVWFMDGTNYVSDTVVPQVTNYAGGWRIVGTADFNADGNTDILMQNINSGHLAVWFMDGTNYVSDTVLPQVTNYAGGWRIVGTADFNADGKPDILMQNINTGQLAIWFMDGTDYVSDTVLPQVTNYAGGWRIVGTADYNADSKPDILMQNINTGQLAIWFMDGSTYVSDTVLSQVTNYAGGWWIVGPR